MGYFPCYFLLTLEDRRVKNRRSTWNTSAAAIFKMSYYLRFLIKSNFVHDRNLVSVMFVFS